MDQVHIPPTKPTPQAAPDAASPDAAAPSDRGEETLSRTGWKTIGIPTNLYEEIAKKRVPHHSKSIQAYVHHWVRVGLLVDAALDHQDQGSVAENLVEALKDLASSTD